VSVSSTGEPADGPSYAPSLSADGRFVAFASDAKDLTADDGNGSRDVFVHDRRTGRTERISRTATGAAPDGASDLPRLSADGRFVAFASDASDLVAGDRNGVRDVFVADRSAGRIERVSAPGREPDGPSDWPAIRADGGAIAFVSEATNLAARDRNGVADVFLWERDAFRLLRLSEGEGGADGEDESGAWGLAQSGDGRCVAFTSLAANLVPGDVDDGRSELFLAQRR
jgi:Tol biopolymer transport system component